MQRDQALGKAHELAASCPHCRHPFDFATGVGHDSAPRPGAVTVCFGCTGVSVFDGGLGLRKATLDELVALEDCCGGEVLGMIRAAIRLARAASVDMGPCPGRD